MEEMVTAVRSNPWFQATEVTLVFWGVITMLATIAGIVSQNVVSGGDSPIRGRVLGLLIGGLLGLLLSPLLFRMLSPEWQYTLLSSYAFIWVPNNWSEGTFIAIAGACVGAVCGLLAMNVAVAAIGALIGAGMGAVVGFLLGVPVGLVMHGWGWNSAVAGGASFVYGGALVGAALMGLITFGTSFSD